MYPYNVRNQRLNISSKEGAGTTYAKAVPPKNNAVMKDERILEMLKNAIIGEMQDAAKYKQYYENIDNPESKAIIRSIYLDELKHRKMFEDMYFMFAGERPVIECPLPQAAGETFIDDCLSDEMAGLRFYSRLYGCLEDQEMKDMLIEVMADESTHMCKLNTALSKSLSK